MKLTAAELARLDAATQEVTARVPLPAPPAGLGDAPATPAALLRCRRARLAAARGARA